MRTTLAEFPFYLRRFTDPLKPIIAHSPETDLLQKISEQRGPKIFFFHGAEVRDYRRLLFNYSTEELEAKRSFLDDYNQRRLCQAARCLSDPEITKVFVSEFLRNVAEQDTRQTATNAYVIHNYIDGDFYRFTQRPDEAFKRILLIRSFQFANYANDIAVEAIRLLASRPGFQKLQFKICGFGALFESLTEPVKALPNVSVEKGYKTQEQIRELHGRHGIFLCPSRFDTQGISLGEAMASGMLCITNRVAAIPEFADNTCAALVEPNNPAAFAEAMWRFAHDSAASSSVARAAARRVRSQCGFAATIDRELKLISVRS